MKMEFILKKEHLDLLTNAYVSWFDCEYGAPAIDCKRPYGNGDVADDMREILNSENLSDEECRKLHNETEIALQIVLMNINNVQLGKYTINGYGKDWKFVG